MYSLSSFHWMYKPSDYNVGLGRVILLSSTEKIATTKYWKQFVISCNFKPDIFIDIMSDLYEEQKLWGTGCVQNPWVVFVNLEPTMIDEVRAVFVDLKI